MVVHFTFIFSHSFLRFKLGSVWWLQGWFTSHAFSHFQNVSELEVPNCAKGCVSWSKDLCSGEQSMARTYSLWSLKQSRTTWRGAQAYYQGKDCNLFAGSEMWCSLGGIRLSSTMFEFLNFFFFQILISFSPQELQTVTRAWCMYRWKQNILSLRKPDGVYSSVW